VSEWRHQFDWRCTLRWLRWRGAGFDLRARVALRCSHLGFDDVVSPFAPVYGLRPLVVVVLTRTFRRRIYRDVCIHLRHRLARLRGVPICATATMGVPTTTHVPNSPMDVHPDSPPDERHNSRTAAVSDYGEREQHVIVPSLSSDLSCIVAAGATSRLPVDFSTLAPSRVSQHQFTSIDAIR
jgi:hypothetical protein